MDLSVTPVLIGQHERVHDAWRRASHGVFHTCPLCPEAQEEATEAGKKTATNPARLLYG
jgi:hypothetical protein